MDDVAKEAGVSKKTVYQLVADKNDLVMQVARQLVACHNADLVSCREAAANAVEEVALQAKLPFCNTGCYQPSIFL